MKKLHISLIEFNYHSEVLRNTCLILENSPIKLMVYTTDKIWEKTGIYKTRKPENIQWVLCKTEKERLKNFFKIHLDELNSSDIILFNTIDSYYRFFSSLKLYPTLIVRIHNSNTFFGSFFHIYRPRFSGFYLRKDLSCFIRNIIGKAEWHYRKKFLNQVCCFAFPGKLIRQYAINEFHISSEQALYLPFSFISSHHKRDSKKEKLVVTMTVIGRVDKRYRNYEVLYHAFTRIVPCLNQYRIKLVLLGSSGSSYGRKVIQQFQDLENDFFSFVAFQGFVKQSHFEEYVNQSDFFIIPLVLETRNTIYNEIYGKTKISGSVNDIIHYQKPALISSGYPLEDALKMITEPFTNDKELADKILKWCSEKTYASFDMTKILKEYTQQSIRDHYVNTFEKCLKQARKTKF